MCDGPGLTVTSGVLYNCSRGIDASSFYCFDSFFFSLYPEVSYVFARVTTKMELYDVNVQARIYV